MKTKQRAPTAIALRLPSNRPGDGGAATIMSQDLYRNSDFIPDFAELLGEIAARSRELASRVDMAADVPYGPGPRHKMDIVFPKQRVKGAPLHLFIHGGYWRAGCKEDHTLLAAPVLAAGGIAAIVGYDLMPGCRLGPIVGQVRDAARRLAAMAPELDADPARLTASGHSAGGHLASFLAAAGPQEQGAPALAPLRGLLLLSGLYDLKEIPGSFLKDEAKMTPEEASEWSPVTSRQLPCPRRIIMLGEHDTPPYHDQAQRFSQLLTEHDLESELRIEPGLNHLTVLLALSDPNSPTGQCLTELVAA